MAEAALKMISEDVKEFFAVRNLGAEVYFSSLPPRYFLDLKDDANLVSQFFVFAALNKLCSAASFEQV